MSNIFSISIPHGTIKRSDILDDLSDSKIFQFHMVRLKVIVNVLLLVLIVISIPHGTIKSSIVINFLIR